MVDCAHSAVQALSLSCIWKALVVKRLWLWEMDTASWVQNPGLGCLHFILRLYLWERFESNYSSLKLYVNCRVDWLFNFGMTASQEEGKFGIQTRRGSFLTGQTTLVILHPPINDFIIISFLSVCLFCWITGFYCLKQGLNSHPLNNACEFKSYNQTWNLARAVMCSQRIKTITRQIRILSSSDISKKEFKCNTTTIKVFFFIPHSY